MSRSGRPVVNSDCSILEHNRHYAKYEVALTRHPNRVKRQKFPVSGCRFREARLSGGMGVPACADLLRVSERTIRGWESGATRIPYAAFKLLRLLRGGKVLGSQWRDFYIRGDLLVTPEGHTFHFGELAWHSLLIRQARMFRELVRIQKQAASGHPSRPAPASEERSSSGLVYSSTSGTLLSEMAQGCGPRLVAERGLAGDRGCGMKRPRLPFPLPLSADDVCRHALAAYYASSQDCTPDPSDQDPATWANPSDFVRFLLHTFAVRVQANAHAAGCPGFDEAPALLAKSERPLYWPALQVIPCSGGARGAEAEPLRVAAMDGRASAPGACPPGSAVGPAARSPHGADITLHESPLLHACAMQRLPELNHRDTLDHAGEKTA